MGRRRFSLWLTNFTEMDVSDLVKMNLSIEVSMICQSIIYQTVYHSIQNYLKTHPPPCYILFTYHEGRSNNATWVCITVYPDLQAPLSDSWSVLIGYEPDRFRLRFNRRPRWCDHIYIKIANHNTRRKSWFNFNWFIKLYYFKSLEYKFST